MLKLEGIYVGNGQLFAVACDEGSLNDIQVILGNDKANQAYREGKLPYRATHSEIVCRARRRNSPLSATSMPRAPLAIFSNAAARSRRYGFSARSLIRSSSRFYLLD